MAFGIGIGQALAPVREVRGLDVATAQISIAGGGAKELAAVLAAGGEPGAVSVGGDPLSAAIVIRLVEGEPSAVETDVLRRIARAGTPLIVLRRGSGHVPYVLPGDVLDAEPEPPVADLAAAIARASGEAAPALAARLPVLREAVATRLIRSTSWSNAALAGLIGRKQPQLPLLSLAQNRMLLQLWVSRGNIIPRDPQGLAFVAGPALAVAVGLGLGTRALVRRLPVGGPVASAAVAYIGTRALGEALLRT